MRYLKLLGWLALYALIFLLANIITGVFLAIVFFLRLFSSGSEMDLFPFILQNMTSMLVISGILTLGFSLLIPLIKGKSPFKYLKFRAMSAWDTTLTIIMGVSFSIFLNCLLTFIRIDQVLPDHITEELMQMVTANSFMAFLAVGIVAPIYEEVLVRGLVFTELKNTLRIWPALIIQGLIFGLMHGNMLQFVYTFPAGILLGYLFLKYRSIWAPIILHVAWNCTSLLMGMLVQAESEVTFVSLMVLSGALFAGCFFYTLKFGPRLPHPGES